MGATYTRQSSYSDGDTITAAHTNDEFNQLLAAFAASTGHTHDGTTAEGGPITKLLGTAITIGDGTAGSDIAVTFDGETSDGVLTWKEDEDYFEFSDDILVASTEKLQFRDTAIYINSSTDGQLDLVADTEIQIAATTVDINGNVDVSGTLTVAGAVDFGDAALSNVGAVQLDSISGDADTNTAITFSGSDVITISTGGENQITFTNGAIVPSTDNDIDLGSSSVEFKDLYIDGTAHVDAISLDGTTITSTAAEINILDGVTATASELNLIDGATAGTVVASKAVVVDSNKDISGFRNLSITGDLTVSGDDITMGTNTAGNLLVADGTNFNSIAVGDLSEISSVAGDDVFIAIDTSGGGLKKITRSAIVSGLATSGAISNVSEDSTPQLGGDLDVNGNDIVSVSNGNITLTPNGTGVVRIDGSNGIDIQSGSISIKNSGTQSYVDFYCESSNAHYARLQAPAHSAFSGNITLTLPATTDTITGIAATQTLTNKTLTSPKINEDVALTSTATELNLLDGVSGLVQADFTKLAAVDSTAAELNILDGVTSSTAELNLVDGSSAGTIVNSKAVIYGSSGEVNATTLQIAGTSITSTAAELNILDGVTSTASELNILDGVTSTATELNLVDGSSAGTIVNSKAVIYGSSGEVNATTLQIAGTSITSTAAELNILDGVTSTATELNVMDGDTSASSITLADADRLVTNDGGTMKQVALTTLKTYLTSAGFSSEDPTALAIALG